MVVCKKCKGSCMGYMMDMNPRSNPEGVFAAYYCPSCRQSKDINGDNY